MYNKHVKKILHKVKDHVIPHSGNEFEPHLLRHRAMKALGLFLLVLELGFLVQVFVVFDTTKFLSSVLPGVLTGQTNQKRAENQLNPLTTNPMLVEAAQLKANDMAARGYFSHNTPEGNTPWYWLDQVGYTYQYAGENLAVNFVDSNEVTEAWMNSPTHRANIVKESYTEIGIAVASGTYKGRDSVFVVQFFGTPYKKPTLSDIIPKASAETKEAIVVTQKTLEEAIKPVVEGSKPEPKLAQEPQNVVKEDAKIPNTKTNSILGDDVEQILTSPKSSVDKTYVVLGLVLAALVLLAWSSSRHTPVRAVLRSVFLIAVIASLVYINEKVIPVQTQVPAESANSVAL